jgi:MoaD family protein
VLPSILTRQINGENEVMISASTLQEALDKLVNKYGASFKERIFDTSGNPKRFLNFYVNGRNVRFIKNLNTPLSDSDEVTILPNASGG